ncbi:TonB-dependent receptor [Pseudoxanthomonas sp. PXM02]|uniref:TonB-dependent receptor n=1 Tax=Pseudoxanthomonas sp. PXM02 TaxID=2769294 RepID=UPI00177A8264|nr:TonB-dependent receptor [Pseudoxanthomonas sp. PXM02]MBD9478403.1 TonB-dependent receptor [Pseudoxanthomonas sp. PXM02]
MTPTPRPVHRPVRHALASALGVALALSATQALAQQSPDADAGSPTQLDTIVVTAQKREQQVSEVPIAITAYSGDFLDRQGMTTLGDLAGFVPGLQVQEQSPNNPGYVIRGITSDSGEANVQPRISVFQDGVSISRSRGASAALFDMERVEVLRGPQGTLFGRAAQVGAVHYIQNKAKDDTSGAFELGAGSDSQRLASGYFNAQIAPEALAARVAVFHEERDGSIENAASGTLNGKDTTALRASLGAMIGEASRIDLIANYQKDTPPGTAFISGTIPNRQGSTSPFADAELNRGEELGLDRTVRSLTALGSFWLGGNWTLDTISGWRSFDSHEEFDADGSRLKAMEFAEIAEGDQFSQEVRFNFDNDTFAGFFGASYFVEDGSQYVPFATDERSLLALLSQDPSFRQQIGALLGGIPFPAIPLFGPDGNPLTGYTLPGGLHTLLNPDHREAFANYGSTTSWDVFLDGTWRATPSLELSAGLRATWEKQTAGYQGFAGNAPTLFNGLGAGAPAPLMGNNILNSATAGKLERSENFDSVVGRVAARYVFSPTLSGFATVSRGRRPNVIDITPQGSQILPAEIVNSYEIGIKGGTAGGRLAYDVSAYWYDYSDFQTQIPNPSGGTPFLIPTNGGNATAKGIEASITGEVADGLVLFANYAWTHARFDDRDDDGNAQLYAGHRFRLTPDHAAAIGMDWRVPMGSASFYLRPSYNWKSKVYFEDENTPGLEQDAYGLFNLRMGVTLADGRWDLGVWGSNLTGEDYLIDAGNTGRQFGTPTFVAGQPRAYGITAKVRF